MKIILNNNKSKLVGSAKIILALRNHKAFATRVKGAFFTAAFRKRQWDGYMRFITETGVIDTGKVPEFLTVLKEEYPKEMVEIIDEREKPEGISDIHIPKQVGNLKPRPYQIDAVKSIALNKLGDTKIRFPRGIIQAATNAGKTLIAAMLHLTFNGKTLFIINSKDLLNQAIKEIPQLLPGKVGILASGHKLEWNDFMIVMVKTAHTRMSDLHRLSEYSTVLVDECDLAKSKTYRSVLNHTYNSYVRVGLSGSALADPRKKEDNQRLISIFGIPLFRITNRELMDGGHSSEIKAYMWEGNVNVRKDNYIDEYLYGIVKNKDRNRKIMRRAKNHIYKRNRLPVMIMAQKHQHILILYKLAKKMMPEIRIDWVHHKRKERYEIVEAFARGEIDLLITSYILKRGQNLPLMKALLNAGGGDSVANVLQIMGRATRFHESKDYTVVDDFYDKGKYLLRHSKHRCKTYKDEKVQFKLKV